MFISAYTFWDYNLLMKICIEKYIGNGTICYRLQCFFSLKYSAKFGPIPPSEKYVFFPIFPKKIPSQKKNVCFCATLILIGYIHMINFYFNTNTSFNENSPFGSFALNFPPSMGSDPFPPKLGKKPWHMMFLLEFVS